MRLSPPFKTYTNDQLLVTVVDIVGTNVGKFDSVLGGDIEGGIEIFNRLGLNE